jgi:SAM-dependent methyltransferase
MKYIFLLVKKMSRRNLYKLFKNSLHQLKSKKTLRILNIGSGGPIQGIIESSFSEKITNIDIDSFRNPDFVMDVTKLEFENNSFDLVVMMEVLEHVKEPHIAISEIYRVLAHNGKLILSTPFILGIHDEPHDFYRFTKYGLEYLLNDFNIEIEETNDFIHTILVLIGRLLRAKFKRDKLIGLIIFLLLLSLYPILFIISKALRTKDISTGYFIQAIKN